MGRRSTSRRRRRSPSARRSRSRGGKKSRQRSSSSKPTKERPKEERDREERDKKDSKEKRKSGGKEKDPGKGKSREAESKKSGRIDKDRDRSRGKEKEAEARKPQKKRSLSKGSAGAAPANGETGERGRSTSSEASRKKGAALLKKLMKGSSSAGSGSSASSSPGPRRRKSAWDAKGGESGVVGIVPAGASPPSPQVRGGFGVAPAQAAAAPVATGMLVSQEAMRGVGVFPMGPDFSSLVNMGPAAGGIDAVSIFLASNKMDIAAGNALRALPLHLQQAVIAEGPVHGRNPSAIVMARIRRVQTRL